MPVLSSKWQFYNVVILGTGFFLLFTAFQTTANVETTTIGIFFSPRCNSTTIVPYADSLGFYSLCIIYFFVSVFTWFSPPITGFLGHRLSLIICGAAYCLLMGALVYPLIPTIFITSAILGAAGGVLWTAQGQVLFANSDKNTIGRNSGIFWLMLQMSLVAGNLYYYLFVHFVASGHSSANASSNVCFDHTKNIILYSTLTGLGIIGVLVFIFLRKNVKNEEEEEDKIKESKDFVSSEHHTSDVTALIAEGDTTLSRTTKDIQRHQEGPGATVTGGGSKYRKHLVQAYRDFIRSFQILFTFRMGILVLCFVYTGLELTFWSGVYGTLSVRTLNDSSVAGLVGMMVGVGEFVGGGLFGILGHWTRKMGRDPIVLGGLFIHIVAYFIIFLIIPSDATYNVHTENVPYFFYGRPEIVKPLVLLTAFLLGFGDSCFNTQIYSILGEVYTGRDGGPAMALFKFFQSISACVAFLYNGLFHVDLQWQLLILVLFGVMGTIAYIIAEWQVTGAFAKKRVSAKEN